MTETNLQKLNDFNFKQIGITWIGKIDDYYFSIEDVQDSEERLLISIQIEPNENKSKFIEYLDKSQKDGLISEYNLDKNEINILFNENSSQYVDDFLNNVCSVLKEIDAINICTNCECTENLAFYTNGVKTQLLCETCGKNVLTQLENEKNKDTNYLKGFLASLAGAMVGSVLWIVLGAIGFVASIAGFLIALGAFTGYEKVKGKLTRKGIVLNVIAILIAFLFAQYAVIYIILRKDSPDWSILVYIFATPMLFSNPEFLKAVLQDMGLGLLFVVLGTYRKISENYKNAKNAENLTIEKIEF